MFHAVGHNAVQRSQQTIRRKHVIHIMLLPESQRLLTQRVSAQMFVSLPVVGKQGRPLRSPVERLHNAPEFSAAVARPRSRCFASSSTGSIDTSP